MKVKEANDMPGGPAMRIDKWLKIARLIKTRAKAAKACDEKKIKINGSIAKASKLVKAGDVVTIKRKGTYRTFDVLGISSRSISAEKARELYNENVIEISDESKELMELFNKATRGMRPKYKGRPTKRERRDISKLRGY
jgi:ribosome-associated heat shock protein Hsp15